MNRTNYFYRKTPEYDIYTQTRYYTPIGELSYEAVVICVTANGEVHQFKDDYNEDIFQWINSNSITISESDFRKIQEEKLLGDTWQRFYDDFYVQWKDYYQARKKAVESSHEEFENNTLDYYIIKEQQYKEHLVYQKRNLLHTVEIGISQQNNPSLDDAFSEARRTSTMEYTKRTI